MTFAHWSLFFVASVTASGELTVPGYNRCGVRGQKPRIVFGTQAEPHEFPWQVLVMYNGSQCGGSILNKEWILTAAHCFDSTTSPDPTSPDPALVDIGVGLTSLRSSLTADDETKGSGFFKAVNIKVHVSYDNIQLSNDIALVQLSTTIDFSALESANVRQICLPSPRVDAHIQKSTGGNELEYPDGSDARREACIVSGWGLDEHKLTPDFLFYITTPLVGNYFCGLVWWMMGINETQICAMVNNPTAGATNKDACQGDSGGPLVCKLEKQTQFVQMGIVSYGDSETAGCGTKIPTVYARVSAHVEWIRASTNANDLAIFNSTPGRISSVLRSRPQIVTALMVSLYFMKIVC